MKLKILGLLIAILFVISACNNAVEEQTNSDDLVAEEDSVEDESPVVDEETPVDENVKEFTLRAFNWDFEPSEIRVNEGDKVIIIPSISTSL